MTQLISLGMASGLTLFAFGITICVVGDVRRNNQLWRAGGTIFWIGTGITFAAILGIIWGTVLGLL